MPKKTASNNGGVVLSPIIKLAAISLVGMILLGSNSITSSFIPNTTETTQRALSASSSSSGSFQLAYEESLGFFDDVPEDEWLLKKQIAKSRVHVNLEGTTNLQPQRFYQSNWNPDFACEMEDFIGPGGDGGKWVCDPHRVNRPGCLVYSVGSNNHFDFELYVQKSLPNCEIHIFDFDDYSAGLQEWGISNAVSFPLDF